MKPIRAMLVEPVMMGGRLVQQQTPVWITSGESKGVVEIEYGSHRATVAIGSVCETPVPRPSLDELRRLDPCFGLPMKCFVEETIDQSKYFRVLRCKEHNTRFLEDCRGGIAMYTRLIYVSPDNTAEPIELWRGFHRMSDDWLNHLGIAL